MASDPLCLDDYQSMSGVRSTKVWYRTIAVSPTKTALSQITKTVSHVILPVLAWANLCLVFHLPCICLASSCTIQKPLGKAVDRVFTTNEVRVLYSKCSRNLQPRNRAAIRNTKVFETTISDQQNLPICFGSKAVCVYIANGVRGLNKQGNHPGTATVRLNGSRFRYLVGFRVVKLPGLH